MFAGNMMHTNRIVALSRQGAGWVVVVVVAGWMMACASSKPTAGGSASTVDYNNFEDDLAVARPRFTLPTPATPNAAKPAARPAESGKRPLPSASPLHVNKRLDAVLDTIAARNRSIRYAPGYRIQVYVGNERQDVDRAKVFTYQNFPELDPYLSFRQPTYRLKVGDFMRRLDAERYLAQLRQQFTSAILVPDKVDIRKSLLIK